MYVSGARQRSKHFNINCQCYLLLHMDEKAPKKHSLLLWEVTLKQFTFTDQLKPTCVEDNHVHLNNTWYLDDTLCLCCYVSYFFDYSVVLNLLF